MYKHNITIVGVQMDDIEVDGDPPPRDAFAVMRAGAASLAAADAAPKPAPKPKQAGDGVLPGPS